MKILLSIVYEILHHFQHIELVKFQKFLQSYPGISCVFFAFLLENNILLMKKMLEYILLSSKNAGKSDSESCNNPVASLVTIVQKVYSRPECLGNM